MTSQPGVSLYTKGIRVEFKGHSGPANLVVPVVFESGKHQDVYIKISPSNGITLDNTVIVGDALQETFSNQHSVSGGASFFAEANYSFTTNAEKKIYNIVWTPNFQGIIFRLEKYITEDGPIGVQFAFPITNYEPDLKAEYIAEVKLEVKRKAISSYKVPLTTYPNAGRVLLMSGYSFDQHNHMFKHPIHIAGLRLPFIEVSDLQFPSLDDITQMIATGFEGIHIFTNITNRGILISNREVIAQEFFKLINGLGVKFIYMDTCNSVGTVSAFRTTDIGALIAATENLYVNYADEFELSFYQSLGRGEYVSNAFKNASQRLQASFALNNLLFPSTRSGNYDPMFLDLRSDTSFREKRQQNRGR